MSSQLTLRTLSPRSGYFMLVLLIVLVAIGKVVLSDTMDPDAFWHLRVAEQLHQDGIGPLVDHLSYASIQIPWTPYSWLGELFMKWVWDIAGFRGAMVVTAICSTCIIVFTAMSFLEIRAIKKQSYFTLSLMLVVVAYFTLAYISFRPVTFALALLSLSNWLMNRDRKMEYSSNWVWMIPAITVLMTNIHIYSIFPVALVSIHAIALYFTQRIHFRRTALLAFYTLLGASCTPMLHGMISTMQRYNDIDPMVASNFISEMRPFYTGVLGQINLAIVVGLLGVSLIKREKMNLVDWMLVIFGMIAIFRLGRFSPIFAILSVPVFAGVFPALNDRVLTKPPIRYAMALVAMLGIVNISLSFPIHTSFDKWLNRHVPDAPGYPTEAANYVERNIQPTRHRLINEFNWGGYLAFRLGKNDQVLMDGRTQLYTPTFWNNAYFNGLEAQKAFLQSQHADAAILPTQKSAFADHLLNLGWKKVYEDPVAVVFVPPVTIPPSSQP